VALDFPVVARRVGRDPLVSRPQQCPSERLCAIAGPVVGDDSLDVGDPVGGIPGMCAVEEPDRGDRLLIGQRFGVGEAGVAIDGRVEVDVAATLWLALCGG